jgi:hypothetical protein
MEYHDSKRYPGTDLYTTRMNLFTPESPTPLHYSTDFTTPLQDSTTPTQPSYQHHRAKSLSALADSGNESGFLFLPNRPALVLSLTHQYERFSHQSFASLTASDLTTVHDTRSHLFNTETSNFAPTLPDPNSTPKHVKGTTAQIFTTPLDFDTIPQDLCSTRPGLNKTPVDSDITPPDFDIKPLWDEVRATIAANAEQSTARRREMGSSIQSQCRIRLGVYFEEQHIVVDISGASDSLTSRLDKLKHNTEFEGTPNYTREELSAEEIAEVTLDVEDPGSRFSLLQQLIFRISFGAKRAPLSRRHSPQSSGQSLQTSKNPAPSLQELVINMSSIAPSIPTNDMTSGVSTLGSAEKVSARSTSDAREDILHSGGDDIKGVVSFELKVKRTWGNKLPDPDIDMVEDISFLYAVAGDSQQQVCNEWAIQAHKTLTTQLRVRHFGKGENKPSPLTDMFCFGYLVLKCTVEIWEMSYEPALSAAVQVHHSALGIRGPPLRKSQPRARPRNYDSNRSSAQFVIRKLGELSFGKLEDWQTFNEVHKIMMRWGLVHCEAYVKNVHQYCLSKGADDLKMSKQEMETYWSSS